MFPASILLPFHNPVSFRELQGKRSLFATILRHLLTDSYLDYVKQSAGDKIKAYKTLDIFHNTFDDDLEIMPSVMTTHGGVYNKLKTDDKIKGVLSNVFRDVYHLHRARDDGNIITGIIPTEHADVEDIVENLHRMFNNRDKDIPSVSYVFSPSGKRGLVIAQKGIHLPDADDVGDFDKAVKGARKQTVEQVKSYLSSVVTKPKGEPRVLLTKVE